MKASDVVELYELLEGEGIDVWLDGGWGVDALLCKQTRKHEDVDIVLQEKDLSKLRELLEARGFKDVPRDDTSPWNFVLGDNKGYLVDIHAFHFDANGNGIYGNRGETYPAGSLKGSGRINGKEVKCVTAEEIVKFHTDYDPDENDIKDVTSLCEKFGIELPKEYKVFKSFPR